MEIPSADELRVERIGEATHPSPLLARRPRLEDDLDPILAPSTLTELLPSLDLDQPLPVFEAAGPRRMLCFDPSEIGCGVLTCGGLCPGVNDVIRSITLALNYSYGTRRVLGFRYGYAGLADPERWPPLELTQESVKNIHHAGGSILGVSRGPQDVGVMVDQLQRLGVSILFVIGGDGTLRGASALAEEIRTRKAKISVVGIPKTIDNDLRWLERTFGFATAVDEAGRAVSAAHVEARSALDGIGLVKLMGRHAGFITAHATLASGDVNFCLIPEVRFDLDGVRGLLRTLERRLDASHHAVIVVAEGAGQDLFPQSSQETDASGNVKLNDIGMLLREEIGHYFRDRGRPVTIKYIDPSYMIRGRAANPLDSELCLALGQHAVHAGMAGRTNLMVGRWHRDYIHVPIAQAVMPRQLDPEGEVWRRVLEATGQPASMQDDDEDTSGR